MLFHVSHITFKLSYITPLFATHFVEAVQSVWDTCLKVSKSNVIIQLFTHIFPQQRWMKRVGC